MGIVERKQREKEQRRLTILQKAEEIIIRKGLIATTMDEIASACELSKGTLYLYFKSKEELYRQIMINIIDNFVQIVLHNLNLHQDYERRLNSLGESYLEFYRKFPNQFKIMNDTDCEHDHAKLSSSDIEVELFERSGKIWQIVESVIEEGISLGYFIRECIPMEIGIMIWASSNGIIKLIEHIKSSHGSHPVVPENKQMQIICRFSEWDYEKMLFKLWESIFDSIRVKPLNNRS